MGLAVAQGVRRAPGAPAWLAAALAVFAASAPDLDFVPGILVGDANRFHQGPSHSLAAAFLFGAIVYLLVRIAGAKGLRLAVLGCLAYASHLLLDFFTQDKRAPFGIPLFWLVSSESFLAPWPVFGGVKHGVPGDSIETVLSNILSLANVATVAVELVIVLPILLASTLIGRKFGVLRGATARKGALRRVGHK